MKKIAILFLTTLFAYGQQEKTSLSIESIFNESAMVFSGQVADKQSYWNVGRKMIYTVHRVKVSKSFKGDQDQIVYVVTEGGAVGLQGVAVKPSVKIERESSGFFMVKNANEIELGHSIVCTIGVLKKKLTTTMAAAGAARARMQGQR